MVISSTLERRERFSLLAGFYAATNSEKLSDSLNARLAIMAPSRPT
jgi:hypothetical protein